MPGVPEWSLTLQEVSIPLDIPTQVRRMRFRQCELPCSEIVAPSVLRDCCSFRPARLLRGCRLMHAKCAAEIGERKIGARRNAPMHDGCAVLCTVE